MNMKDDVAKLYKPSKWLGNVEIILYFLDIIAAIVSLYSSGKLSSITIWMQIIFALLYFGVNIVDDGVFWYKAECQRRLGMIEDGFKKRLSEYQTEGYYDNDQPPSLLRYGLNTMQSNYYSKEIATKMVFPRVIVAVFATIALIISCRLLQDSPILLIFSQTVFSTYVLVELVMMLIYRGRLEVLYNEAYKIMCVSTNRRSVDEVWLLSYALEYEAIKAYYKVRLNERFYKKNEKNLAKDWETIKQHILDQKDEANSQIMNSLDE